MTTIRLDGVSRHFAQGRRALHGVSLEIQAGELFVLLGPSGSGKTTLLRLIAGLDEPSSGQIWFGDQRVDRWSAARRRIAMVFQEPALYPHWTVRQHLLSTGSKWSSAVWPWFKSVKRLPVSDPDESSVSKREVVLEPARVSLEKLGLEPLLNRKPHQLSGGERQRVALGRAIVRDPAAFLFDEPFSSLDVATRWQLRHDVLRVQRELSRTMVFVTHDQSEALAMADRLGVLVGGVLKQVGLPQDVYGAPCHVEVARMTGDPPMNLWSGQAWCGAAGWRVESRWWSGEVKALADRESAGRGLDAGRSPAVSGEAKQVWLGVRPERIRWNPVGKKSAGERAPENWKLAQVETLEFLGNRWVGIVRLAKPEPAGHADDRHAKADPRIWVSSAAPAVLRVGDSVQLDCSTEDIHLFDAASGERLMKAG